MASPQLSEEAGTVQIDEPLLNVKNIQGNIIPGFNKDFQVLLFLKIENGKESNFRRWLEALIPGVTTMEHVLAFRSFLQKEQGATKLREGSPKLKLTWRNIAFSHAALERLGVCKVGDFKDEAFTEGLTPERSTRLGDPTGEDDEGNPRNWVVGGPDNEADVLLIVASDDRADLWDEVTRIENSIYAPPKMKDKKPERSGLRIIFKQYETNLPDSREHFGFRDGLSQPGVRGQVPDSPGGYLTRGYKIADKPGQDAVWPGEFVFGPGYPKQDPHNLTKPGPPSLDKMTAPEWAEDGSLLVFRRLRQDVGAFHKFLHDTARKLNSGDPNLLGAKCVGRWASSAPIVLTPNKDDVTLAQAKENNDFKFKEKDFEGAFCPFASHIRKVYPRDDVLSSEETLPPENQSLNESISQTHRLLRRGIPYGGPSLSSPTAPFPDTVDRGLLFLAYQTSIENQFEFLQRQANNPDFKEKRAGYDPIIGQNGQAKTRERYFMVAFKDKDGKEQQRSVPIPDEWVIPTGGGYFFAPSIKVLQLLANLI